MTEWPNLGFRLGYVSQGRRQGATMGAPAPLTGRKGPFNRGMRV